MVGNYSTSSVSLEKRRPVWLFWPLAWLAAGPLNPIGFMQFLRFEEFNETVRLLYWATGFALPFALATAFTLWFIRNDGLGIWEIALTFLLSCVTAIGVVGIGGAYAIWFVQERMGLIQTGWPLYDVNAALGLAGDLVRTGAFSMLLPLPLSVILLRLIGLRREAKKPTPKYSLD